MSKSVTAGRFARWAAQCLTTPVLINFYQNNFLCCCYCICSSSSLTSSSSSYSPPPLFLPIKRHSKDPCFNLEGRQSLVSSKKIIWSIEIFVRYHCNRYQKDYDDNMPRILKTENMWFFVTSRMNIRFPWKRKDTRVIPVVAKSFNTETYSLSTVLIFPEWHNDRYLLVT
jgi:hypothetical protein